MPQGELAALGQLDLGLPTATEGLKRSDFCGDPESLGENKGTYKLPCELV